MAAYVYIMASRRNGTLYTGVTNNLVRRAWEHCEGVVPGFAKSYGCKSLAWFESHDEIAEAIRREQSIKRYYRQWKINLIEAGNPEWSDLYDDIAS